jgi:hypothetical protein
MQRAIPIKSLDNQALTYRLVFSIIKQSQSPNIATLVAMALRCLALQTSHRFGSKPNKLSVSYFILCCINRSPKKLSNSHVNNDLSKSSFTLILLIMNATT